MKGFCLEAWPFTSKIDRAKWLFLKGDMHLSNRDMGPKKIMTWDISTFEIQNGTRGILSDRDM